MKKKTIIALSIFFAIILTLGILYIRDYSLSKKYNFELVAVKYPTQDKVIIADGVSSLRMRVKLTDKEGNAIEGHTIYIYASNGSLPTSKVVTNSSGYIDFYYYPYLYVNEKVSPLEDVTIYFQDESNSKVFLVPAKWSYTIKAVKPLESSNQYDWQGIPIVKEGD